LQPKSQHQASVSDAQAIVSVQAMAEGLASAEAKAKAEAKTAAEVKAAAKAQAKSDAKQQKVRYRADGFDLDLTYIKVLSHYPLFHTLSYSTPGKYHRDGLPQRRRQRLCRRFQICNG
jgi:hypothetical protein